VSRRFGAIPTNEVCYGHASVYIHPSANMIWDPVGVYPSWGTGNIFTGKVNGNPTSTSIPYDTDVNELALSPNMVLHNTTKGKKVRIVTANTTTNVITVEANSPDDSDLWDDNDVLTTASQTNTGRTNGFSDFDVTALITYANSQAIFIQATLVDTGASSSATMICHPYETYVQAKETFNLKLPKPATLGYIAGTGIIPLTWEGSRCYITMGIFWPTTLVDGLMSFLGEF